MPNADDLDDGLDYNYESDPEAEEVAVEDTGAEESKDSQEDEPEEKPHDDDKKRKAGESSEREGRPLSKRQKKLQNSKLKDKKEEQVKYQLDKKKTIPKSSPEEIVEYLATLIREKNPDLSGLELDEMYLKKSDFLSTEKFQEDRNLTNLPNFMSQFSKSPRTIVLSLTNLRIADIYRSLGGNKACVKLFAKNKLKDDLATVEEILSAKSKKNEHIRYFIATPTRLEKLIESTDLFFQGKEKLDILLDASYMDPKANTLLNCENTTVLCKLLKTFLNKKSSVKVLLY
ncbi:hypothetical protein ZYGR_0A04980 [Zygosaccharomyces rouxii]|uniref:ZYRO0A11418p n=2 Tax=Zygosaccharomyces rouxii TaxID=4956 RepID=C5DQG7_ZYGRC|nr:uncharacterized protein ZYRO0A11418g [Zygosaccharomyces rouxii]KAH9198548.1 U3-containing 90S pre-ribosomal complex subunit-domain containing protein [Zygosaccharomyces rouxii]GAV46900.1 hypothetical protein ZYGR_0A04980 [Zygosaccharomyces rouxii]CAR25928.1 ZYRO0A11418p [Zygosaccharomyces rouxii]